MAIAVIDSGDAAEFGSNADLVINEVIPVGAEIFVGFANDSTFDIDTLTDDGGNTYTIATVQENSNPGDTFSANTARTIVTTQLNPGDAIHITASGGSTSASFLAATGLTDFDGESTGMDEGFPPSSPTDSGDVVTTEDDVLLVGYNVMLDGTKTFTSPSTGFTQVHDFPSAGDVLRYQLEYRIVSVIGTYTTNATLSAASYWISRLTAFKAAAGAAPVASAGYSLLTSRPGRSGGGLARSQSRGLGRR